jgi:hypothetical protein
MPNKNTNRPDLFTHTINQLRYGQTAQELSDHVAACVNAARDTGKMAELTIKFKFKPEANGAQIFISEEIKPKIPTFPREATILFPTPQGNLQREDPRQTQIPGLRQVNDDRPAEFKQAGA